MHAVISLLFAPWWIFAGLAAAAFWAGGFMHDVEVKEQAEMRQALEQPMPARINLADFDRDADIGLADEVHVGGWVDFESNYHLRKLSRTGSVRSERFMYLLFGANDTFENREVRAALMLTEAEKDMMVDDVFSYMSFDVPAPDGEIGFAFNGTASRSAALSDMANDAIAELGLRKSSDFIYIDPFFDGREAGLTPTGSPEETREMFHQIAMWLGGFGLIKLIYSFAMNDRATPRRRRKSASDSFAASPIQSAGDRVETDVYGSAPVMQRQTGGDLTNDPLARIRERTAIQSMGANMEIGQQAAPAAPKNLPKPSLQDRLSAIPPWQYVVGLVAVLAILKPTVVFGVLPLIILFSIYWYVGRKTNGMVAGLAARFTGGGLPKKDAFSARLDRLH